MINVQPRNLEIKIEIVKKKPKDKKGNKKLVWREELCFYGHVTNDSHLVTSN
jgi:hypothetical protein